MHIFLVILLFAVGIILIVKGGDYFVDAASGWRRFPASRS